MGAHTALCLTTLRLTRSCASPYLCTLRRWSPSSSSCFVLTPSSSSARQPRVARGRAGSAWNAFGGSVAYSPDSGQVDFATVASVSSAGRSGLLDIGTLCLDVIGTGSLRLQVQMKVHIDATATRDCSAGGHLYQDGSRCYSVTPDTVFDVVCSGAGCLRRQLEQSRARGSPSRRMDVSGRAVPMNIDSNGAQLTMADCLYLVEVQQVLTDKQAGTQVVSGRPGRQLARDSATTPTSTFTWDPRPRMSRRVTPSTASTTW